MTSEAEVLWILLAARLRPRLLQAEPAQVEPAAPGRSRKGPGARPPEGRKSGVYVRPKTSAG